MEEPVRINLYAGSCVPQDAISNTLLHKLEILESWKTFGAKLEVTAFVQYSWYTDHPRIRSVPSVARLIRFPEFGSADLHIFEWGIFFELFDAAFLVPPSAPSIGVYHNVTPAEFFEDPEIKDRIERSTVQRHNFSLMTHVVSDSEFSRQELLSLGFAAEKLSVLPLPPMQRGYRSSTGSRDPEAPITLLYVGRFVRSKGVFDLMQAVGILSRRWKGRAQLVMCGNPVFSSPAVLDEVRNWCAGDGAGFATLLLGPSDDHLARLYSEADIFVMPSYHEGYCLPVLEALAADCLVVAYDSTNLPFVLSGLGTLVPTGDSSGLAIALDDLLSRMTYARDNRRPLVVPTERGELEIAVWRERVREYVESLSFETFEDRFAGLLSAHVPRLSSMLERVLRPAIS